MAQQQAESLSDVNKCEDMSKNCPSNMQNGTDSPTSNAGRNSRSMQQIQGISSNMSDKSNTKSPSNQVGGGGVMHGGGLPPNNGGDTQTSNPYGTDHSMVHYPPPMQHNSGDNQNKDDPYGPQPGSVGHPYSRFHHDPNTPPDHFARYGHPPMQPGKPPGILPPNRPPQRFIPGQSPQGPTPTLNSLLQSHPPPPPQHRYPSSYDPQQQASQQPTPQSYNPQQSWAPPPRPYSPQLGASQAYRTPPPANASRGQSPYPPPGQNSGSYPPSPQQGGPPPPQNQGPATSQYAPYPQRYPTPPSQTGGPNHRSPYPTHQYPEPNRPWPSGPGGPSPAASPGPGGHPHPPASPHQAQHGGPPPSSSPGHAPSPSPQPPQASPSPHQELIGQNSNDSSSGGISGVGSGPPGTPNPQQAMRPTPSPTSSSGSRSMSPAVGQQSLSMPPRPSSSQAPQTGATQLPPTTSGMISSHQQHLQVAQHQQQPPTDPTSGSTQRSHNSLSSQQPPTSLSSSHQQHQQSGPSSNSMAAQGSNYQSAPPPISHMHGYKMGPSPGQASGPSPQSMPPYPPPQSQQYSQGNYPPRPQYPSSYGPSPSAGQPPPANSMTPSGQYASRPLPNHVGGPHSQFPPYQQSWAPPSPQNPAVMSNHVQGKGTPPPSQGNVVGSPRPLNYLKQHLQHKGGYVGAPSPTPPQGYGNGPGMHLPMGPPHHMGPPPGPTNMGPPTSAPQSTPPIPSAPSGTNSTPDVNSTPDHNSISQDNGVSSSGSSTTSSHPVTSVITTGPDGAPLDEASQQSTLSNASAASGEDPQCVTPKSRKNETYSQSHLMASNSSPGTHPHGDDFEMNSPSTWPRTPASPVFNSHVPQETYRASAKVNFSKKSDSLCKLYDMDDNPERRVWLDKLLHFMEERRTPITACPTISKQPLDLYRLYLLVKERGGFVEVTKSKTWKDIAGLLGIGASSSAAYTLRKHYTKNLLAFECHYDRGDIDPLPIIQQVEAGSKKKTTKAASVPSPAGSSNSQDSFPPSGSTSTSMDGYPPYPSNYPAASQQEYSAPPMQRPPSQNNAQTPHAGNAQQSGDNISVSNPFDDPVGPTRGPYQPSTNYPPSIARSPQGAPYQGQTSYNQFAGTDQYSSPAPPAQYSQTQTQFPPPNRTMYPPYAPEGESSVPATSSSYAPYAPATRPYSQPPAAAAQPQTSTATPTPQGTPTAYPPPPPQQDYYRPAEQIFKNNSSKPVNMSSQLARQLVAPMSPAKLPYQHNTPQPRRHPDFAKESQPYAGYGQRPQVYGGWQNNTGQYRAQYPAQAGTQQWPTGTRPPVPPTPAQPTNQWEQHRYPAQAQQPYPPNQQPWATMNAPNATSPTSALRPPPQRSSGKPFNMPPPQTSNKVVQQQPQPPQSIFGPVGPTPKRDIVFPPDSVEATTPVLYRRKKYGKNDVSPVDPWRIFMALRSSLLAESTWALDILNILLFDDTAVHYFGLQHLPGLLNLLLEHFQKNLADMFESSADKRHVYGWNSRDDENDGNYEVDLGQVTNTPNPEERVLLLTSTPNYTMVSRKGIPVRIQNAEEDIFVSELPKKWDHDSNRNYQLSAPVGSDPWTYGNIEPQPHNGIIDVFKAEIVDIPFARYLKSDKKDKTERDLEDDEIESGDDNYCDIIKKGKDSKNIFTNRRTGKRRLNSKNGWTENNKRTKLKEYLYESRKIAIKDESCIVVADKLIKKEQTADSDCREVDMEIEQPRIFNGPQQQQDVVESKISLDKQPLERDNNIKDEINQDGCSDSRFDPKETVRDPSQILKRRRMSEYEDECYTRDEASLYLVNESQDTLARRCICLSNIFRNLTFVPGNESVLAKSPTFLAILGKLLLLNHEHLVRTQKTRNYDREEDTDFADSCSSLQGENEWWWDYLIQIRENMLVAMANIAGHLELSRYEEIINRPVLDGLLHWAVCPSAHGQDPFPSCGPNTSLSPQRLALEALCKLCVTDANVDLVIATPPFSRLEKLCSVLTRHLCRNEDQVLREFSVNLLHYLAAADSAMSRTVALQSPCISYLVAFIEQAEQTALGVANQHGINYLRENPDSMGTSLDMLRRAAGTLLHLSKHPDNRPLFMQQEQRLLGLVMSHILDQQVALIISRVLFQISRNVGSANSSEYKAQQKRFNKKTAENQQLTANSQSSEDSNSVASSQSLSLASQLKIDSNTNVVNNNNTNNSNSTSSFISTSSSSNSSSKGDDVNLQTNLNFGSNLNSGGLNSGNNDNSENANSATIPANTPSNSRNTETGNINTSSNGSNNNNATSGNNTSSSGSNNKSNNISTTVITNSSSSSSTTPTTAAVA